MNDRTLAIIKPDAIHRRLTGKIIDRILEAGFDILAMKQLRLTKQIATDFYAVHKAKPFFNDLVEFIASGPCITMVLQRENAVDALRELIGATNPAEAQEGTIRREFAESIQNNVVHGSDSIKNATKEIAFFFASDEILEN